MSAWPPRLGLPGGVALLALAVALPLALWFTPQWQAQAEEKTRAARAAAVRASRPAPPAAGGPALPALPAVGDPAHRVADLLALALRHGIGVQGARQQRQQQGPLQRLQLEMSARARYADLRGYVAAALQADAGLALDSLQLRRAAPATPEFDIELRWSLLRDDAAGPARAAGDGPALRRAWPAATRQTLRPWGEATPAAAAVAAAPSAAPASAGRPAAPPFPYRWIGRLDDGEHAQALLASPQRSFGTRAGEVLDGRWRVDAVGATRLQLTWMPTGQAVSVDPR